MLTPTKRSKRRSTVKAGIKYIDDNSTILRSRLKIPYYTNSILPKASLKKLKRLQKKNSAYSLILALLVISLSIYENERYYAQNSEATTEVNIIRFLIILLISIHIYIIYQYYKRKLQIKILYREISVYTKIHEDHGIFLAFVIDVLFSVISTPPFVSYSFTFDQISHNTTLNISDLLIIGTFLRTIHFFKFFFEFSIHNSIRAKFYTDLQYIKSPYKFSAKSTVKEKPIRYIVIIFMTITICSAVLLRIYERSIDKSHLSEFWNGLWLISVTQSTIGYGDIVPYSHLGRLVCVFASVSGGFMYSYIVMFVRRSIILSKKENELYSLLSSKKKHLSKLKLPAVKFIQSWWRLVMSRRNKKLNFENLMKKHFCLQRFKFQRNVCSIDKNVYLDDVINEFVAVTDKELISNIRRFVNIKNYSTESTWFAAKTKESADKLKFLTIGYSRFSEKEQSKPTSKPNSVRSSRINLKHQSEKALFNLIRYRSSSPLP